MWTLPFINSYQTINKYTLKTTINNVENQIVKSFFAQANGREHAHLNNFDLV